MIIDFDEKRKDERPAGSVIVDGTEYPMRRPTLFELEQLQGLKDPDPDDTSDKNIVTIKLGLGVLFGEVAADELWKRLRAHEAIELIETSLPNVVQLDVKKNG